MSFIFLCVDKDLHTTFIEASDITSERSKQCHDLNQKYISVKVVAVKKYQTPLQAENVQEWKYFGTALAENYDYAQHGMYRTLKGSNHYELWNDITKTWEPTNWASGAANGQMTYAYTPQMVATITQLPVHTTRTESPLPPKYEIYVTELYDKFEFDPEALRGPSRLYRCDRNNGDWSMYHAYQGWVPMSGRVLDARFRIDEDELALFIARINKAAADAKTKKAQPKPDGPADVPEWIKERINSSSFRRILSSALQSADDETIVSALNKMGASKTVIGAVLDGKEKIVEELKK